MKVIQTALLSVVLCSLQILTAAQPGATTQPTAAVTFAPTGESSLDVSFVNTNTVSDESSLVVTDSLTDETSEPATDAATDAGTDGASDEETEPLTIEGPALIILGIVNKPKCALVRALITGDEILGGTLEEVATVCDANQTCTDDFLSLFNETAMETMTNAPLDDPVAQLLPYIEDVKLMTEFFCTDDCYAVTKAVAESGGGDEAATAEAVTCPCLSALQEMAAKMSDQAKENLLIDDAFMEEVAAASEAKGCEAPVLSVNKST